MTFKLLENNIIEMIPKGEMIEVENIKVRQSNLELLRIISMILIVMSHCDEIFGLADLYSATTGVNKIITDWLHIGGQIGVGCFILISGYFMIEQKITVKKILKLTGQVWFYTIGIWCAWSIYQICIINNNWISCLKAAKWAFFPILTSHYWFATAYVILMVLSPFFNKLIFSLNQNEYKNLLISVIVIFVILKGGMPNIIPGMSDGRLMPVFIMYFIAGYIKRFRIEKKDNAQKHLLIAVVFYVLLFMSFYLITLLGVKLDSMALINNRYFYRVLNSPLIVVICVELFLCMIESNISNNRIVNKIASCTFGVYLIHCNMLMQNVLSKCFPIYKVQNSLNIIIYSILAVITIYAVCTAIDYIRAMTVGKLWEAFLNKYLNEILLKIVHFLDNIFKGCMKVLYTFYDGKNNKLP